MTDTTINRPRHAWSIPGWSSEKASNDPHAREVWCYTDKPSYRGGETVQVFIHSTASSLTLRVIRDGKTPRKVLDRVIEGDFRQVTPVDAYARGCGWAQALGIDIDERWTPGFYLLRLTAAFPGETLETEHYFVVKAARERQSAVMLLTTSTLAAYNDWGGGNSYRGSLEDDGPSAELSLHRPLGRGFLSKPIGAPRNAHNSTPPPGWVPRHEVYEWAMANGYSRHHADAFWATYERPFVVWAEENGYAFDYLTQWDLHFDPTALDGYQCVVIAGHDEYWSWEMRDVLDAYLEDGGNLARFAGNFIWQIRLSADGATQVCYKDPRLDPLAESQPERLTTLWEHPKIKRPSASTMGLAGIGGCYNRYGTTTPRSSGGFTVYRPEHWAFAGTDLYYGDVFGGAPVCIAAFELDGVEYGFRKGIPYATGEDGAPESLEILAMAPAVVGADDHWNGKVPLGAPAWEVADLLQVAFGPNPPEYLRGKRYGSGMVASFRKGRGTVFNAGTCEWVNGLIQRDPYTETITHNVLNRFLYPTEA
ncbi:N,N-dimethylformamidase beta subunit family domain-containing protein [Pseudomonas chlororaphis subsp. aureofaciens]|uniref:N,N-dimethylformamidase beta subunit family domain-containing protein n=1 Tax=Pseudomonas chlororaphis TaxID=587753 RepID=UPI003558B34F